MYRFRVNPDTPDQQKSERLLGKYGLHGEYTASDAIDVLNKLISLEGGDIYRLIEKVYFSEQERDV